MSSRLSAELKSVCLGHGKSLRRPLFEEIQKQIHYFDWWEIFFFAQRDMWRSFISISRKALETNSISFVNTSLDNSSLLSALRYGTLGDVKQEEGGKHCDRKSNVQFHPATLYTKWTFWHVKRQWRKLPYSLLPLFRVTNVQQSKLHLFIDWLHVLNVVIKYFSLIFWRLGL